MSIDDVPVPINKYHPRANGRPSNVRAWKDRARRLTIMEKA
jgi:hypothetical protein